MNKFFSIAITGLVLLSALLAAEKAWGKAASFIKVVDSATAIPGGQGSFTNFQSPYIYHGKIVFCGFGNNDQAGIYTDLFGQLTLIADKKTPVPNGQGNFVNFGIAPPASDKENEKYQYLNFHSPVLDSESIAFIANDINNQQGLYIFNKNKLHRIADTKISVPGGKGNFKNFYGLHLTNGEAGFLAVSDDEQQGLYAYSKDSLKVIYDTSSLFKDKPAKFTRIFNADFDNGDAAFRAVKPDGSQGIYLYNSGNKKQLVDYPGAGKIKIMADQTTSIPEGKGNFTGFSKLALQAGKVVFCATGIDQQMGIYSNANGKLQRIADLKTRIPSGTGKFTNLQNPSMDNKDIVFIGFGKNNQEGIYLYSKHELQRILDNHQILDNKKIAKLDLGAVAISAKQIAIHVIFQDASQAIYLMNYH